jgi:hypothetical protein
LRRLAEFFDTDRTATPRLLLIAACAIGIGIVGAYVALALLKLIGFFTNLFFFQRLSTQLVTPEAHALGAFVILVPVAGALVIGVMARYGSERNLDAEQRRERVLGAHITLPFGEKRRKGA